MGLFGWVGWLIGWWIELLVGGVELVGGLPGWLVGLVQSLIGWLGGKWSTQMSFRSDTNSIYTVQMILD